MNKPDSQDAHVYALADVADVKLRLKDLDGAQKDLEACQKTLDSFDSVETVVHASFYKRNADYYHVRSSSFPNASYIGGYRGLTLCSLGQGGIRRFLQERSALSCMHKSRRSSRGRTGIASLQSQRRGACIRLDLQLRGASAAPDPGLPNRNVSQLAAGSALLIQPRRSDRLRCVGWEYQQEQTSRTAPDFLVSENLSFRVDRDGLPSTASWPQLDF